MPHVDLRDPITNPVGYNLQDYSSATWVNLGMAPTRVDFGALGVGTPLAAGTLPGGGTYTQAAGAGQSEETVQTSASTVARWAFVANLPRIGYAPDGGTGLVLEPPRTNAPFQSLAFDNASWTKTATTIAADAGAGPDGTTTADRLTSSTSAGVASTLQAAASLDSTTATVSAWVKAGTQGTAFSLRVGAATDSANTTPSASWQRATKTTVATGVGANAGAYVNAGGGSGTAVTGDNVLLWGLQAEVGGYATNLVPSAGVAASRAGFGVTVPVGMALRAGTLRFRQQVVPLGASADYTLDGAAVRLWTLDANTYAEVTTATRILTVVVNGVSRASTVPLWWLYGHRVEFFWEVGNGNLKVRYRYSTDRGGSWTLPFDPFGGTVYTDSAIITSATTLLMCSDTGAAKCFGNVSTQWEGLLTAPAWALQALPTDVASVKAFFRADSSYTLSAGTVSAWAGQTATAVTAFTQATGANQPTFAAAGLGTARPSFTFDGANDYLVSGALSEWITAATGCIYILFKCAAVSTNNAPNYNNHPLVENVGAYAGVALRTGPTAGAFNYDGTYDDASTGFALSTAQVVRWRHASGNVYVRATGSAESAATASGATALLTGNVRLGGNPGVVAVYYQGEIAAAIAANTDPTAAEDAAIMAFLNAYGGL